MSTQEGFERVSEKGPGKCSTHFRSDPISGSKPDPGCSDTTKCNTFFFFFQKCHDPNACLDPNGGFEPELGLL